MRGLTKYNYVQYYYNNEDRNDAAEMFDKTIPLLSVCNDISLQLFRPDNRICILISSK